MKATLGKAGSQPISINVARLLETRLLLTASSGGGKSWAIRRLIEQVADEVMVLVIDPEGEFATLREKHDFVIAGKGGDCPAEPRSADLLARRLLELGASAVLDIYELKPGERVRFVRKFLEGLVNSPKKLWRPCLVIIDEAHAFAPEKGQSESLAAVVDLMSRGRKRGFAGVLATQRLAKLSKDAAAEAINVMVGRFALDIDVRRAAETLGFEKARHQELKRLKPGEFFTFGPALAEEVALLKVGGVSTTHPKAGQRQAAAPAPRAQVRRVLDQLTDLPAEAEEEARTLAEAKKQVRELERDLRKARKDGGPPDEAAIARARREGAAEAEKQIRQIVAQHEAGTRAIVRALEGVIPGIEKAVEAARSPLNVELGKAPPEPARAARSPVPPARNGRQGSPASRSTGNGEIDGPMQRIVDAIAWEESLGIEDPLQTAVAFLANYRFGGGGFNNPKGRLKAGGFVDYLPGNRIRLTDAGREVANAPEAPASAEELHRRVLGKLDGPEQRLLQPLIDAYPEALSAEELAEAAGYAAGSGGFNNPRGRLKTLGLVNYPEPGMVRAADLLFPDGGNL